MIAKLRFFSEDNQQYNFLYNVRFQNAISAKGVGFRLRKTDTFKSAVKKHQHQP
jgi:hypothetical protein